MKLKLILAGLVVGLVVSSCAHAPATQIVDIAVPVEAKKINIPECPVLPINSVQPGDSFDMHLKAWNASLTILQGCWQADELILKELNK